MSSKRIRTRRMFTEPLDVLEVEWNFTQDQFNTFVSFFDTDLENGSLPFQLTTPSSGDSSQEITRDLAFMGGSYSFSRQDNLFTVVASLEVTEETVDEAEVFDLALCGVVIEDGGGDTFDCYPDGEITSLNPLAGVGFADQWQIGDSPLTYVYGDDFDAYWTSGWNNLASGGNGWSGNWLNSDEEGEDVACIAAFVAGGGSQDFKATSLEVTLPKVGDIASGLFVICVARKSPYLYGLEDWSVLVNWRNVGGIITPTIWADVYSIPYEDAPDSLTVDFVAEAWCQLCCVLISSKKGRPIKLQSHDELNNHSVPKIVSTGDGRLALGFSTCYFSATGNDTYGSPRKTKYYVETIPDGIWNQLTERENEGNRFLVSTRRIDGLEATDDTGDFNPAQFHHEESTGPDIEHDGADIALIFRT